MHYLGVEHGDFEPRNVLRKGRRTFIFKIIDFGFSDVDHTCPGWRKCGELKEVWRKLQLPEFKKIRWIFSCISPSSS